MHSSFTFFLPGGYFGRRLPVRSSAWLSSVVLFFAMIPVCFIAEAQEPLEELTESAEISAPSATELDPAITAIQEGQPRIEALMRDIDLSAAEDRLGVSPIESLAEGVADESLDTAPGLGQS